MKEKEELIIKRYSHLPKEVRLNLECCFWTGLLLRDLIQSLNKGGYELVIIRSKKSNGLDWREGK